MIPKKKIKPPLKIEHRPNGKPYIKNYGYDISISHKDNFTVIGKIKKPFKIGVDIENLKADINEKLFLEYFLKGKRFGYKKNLKEEIITLWSIKEAVFKCLGQPNIGIKKIDKKGNVYFEDSKNLPEVRVKKFKNYIISLAVGK